MDGFSGPACERKDCPGFDVTTGGFCKGNGYCMNVREMTELYGFSYGEESDGTVTIPASRTESAATTTTPETWDANNWYECVCANSAALLNQDVMGHVKYPSVGPG